MKASSLWIIGVLTVSGPEFIGHLFDGTSVYQNFTLYDIIPLAAGGVIYFTVTRLIDRRWKLVRK